MFQLAVSAQKEESPLFVSESSRLQPQLGSPDPHFLLQTNNQESQKMMLLESQLQFKGKTGNERLESISGRQDTLKKESPPLNPQHLAFIFSEHSHSGRGLSEEKCYRSYSEDSESNEEIHHMPAPPSSTFRSTFVKGAEGEEEEEEEEGEIFDSDHDGNAAERRDLERATDKLRKCLNANIQKMQFYENELMFHDKRGSHFDHPLSAIDHAIFKLKNKLMSMGSLQYGDECLKLQLLNLVTETDKIIKNMRNWVSDESEYIRSSRISAHEDIIAMVHRQIDRLAREELQEKLLELCDKNMKALQRKKDDLAEQGEEERKGGEEESGKRYCEDDLPPLFRWLEILTQYKRDQRQKVLKIAKEKKSRKESRTELMTDRVEIIRSLRKIGERQGEIFRRKKKESKELTSIDH